MRVRRLAALMALLMVMSGCGAQPEEPPAPEPVTIETLRVEISKNDQSSQSLLQEVRELPELLKAGFDAIAEETGVEVGEVTVTVGTSPAATAQALAEGSVDLAFLPAADLIRSGGDAVAVLAEAENSGLSNAGEVPADWNGSEHATALVPGVRQAGTFSLVCAAPTDYGAQLSARAESGQELTWEELSRARWGVLSQDSLGGWGCLAVWLAENYDGSTVTDLPDVTEYESFEDLLRAAAQGEIDAFPLRADARLDVAEAWTLHKNEESSGGVAGFGREESVWEEVRCISVTPTLYALTAAVRSGDRALTGDAFQNALDTVLVNLGEEQPGSMAAFGSAWFARISSSDLEPLRELLELTE